MHGMKGYIRRHRLGILLYLVFALVFAAVVSCSCWAWGFFLAAIKISSNYSSCALSAHSAMICATISYCSAGDRLVR